MIDRYLIALLLAALAVPGARAQVDEAPADSTRLERRAQDVAPGDTTDVQRVELEADSLIGGTENGHQVRRLRGHVRLRQGTTRLRARAATQYVTRDSILFSGDVRIVDQGDSLWARRVWYDTRRKIGEAYEDVRLTDGRAVVHAPSATYRVSDKQAIFREGLRLVDSLTVLTSRNGLYWTDERQALFFDSVRVVDPEAELTADTVYYERDSQISRARGNVSIVRTDTTEGSRTVAYGARGYYEPAMGDSPSYSRLRGQPLVVQTRRDTTRRGEVKIDTLAVRAGRLEWTQRAVAEQPDAVAAGRVREEAGTLHRLMAVDSVRIWQAALAAVADSAVFDRYVDTTGRILRQELRLYHEPMAWTTHTQISADTLMFARQPRAPDSLFAFTDAFVARRDTSLQRIQQLQGRQVLVLFEGDSLRNLQAGPQAEAIYYLSEQGRSNGAVRVSGNAISFAFEGQEVRQVRVLAGVEGRRYPADQLPEPFKLSHYAWRPELRPRKATLLRRGSHASDSSTPYAP